MCQVILGGVRVRIIFTHSKMIFPHSKMILGRVRIIFTHSKMIFPYSKMVFINAIITQNNIITMRKVFLGKIILFLVLICYFF